MIDVIKNSLKIPEPCYVDRKIFKKLFYENFKFTTLDKRIFKDDVKEVYWLSSIKPENSNIPSFVNEDVEYKEIAYIYTDLRNDKKINRIAEIIHRSIPYATLLFFCVGGALIVSASLKRLSKSKESNIVTEEIITTSTMKEDKIIIFLQTIAHHKLINSNIKDYYNNIVREVLANITLEKIGYGGKSTLPPAEQKKLLDQIVEYEERIQALKKSISKESQFNEKVKMNIEIKNIETLLYEIKKQVI